MTIPPPMQEQLELAVAAAQNRDPNAANNLRHLFERGLQFRLRWELNIEPADDEIELLLTEILQAFERRKAHDSATALEVVNRLVGTYCASRKAQAVSDRAAAAARAVNKEQIAIAQHVLQRFRPRHREALVRYYAGDETEPTICKRLGHTATEFRRIRSKARSRFHRLASQPVANTTPKPNRSEPMGPLRSRHEAAPENATSATEKKLRGFRPPSHYRFRAVRELFRRMQPRFTGFLRLLSAGQKAFGSGDGWDRAGEREMAWWPELFPKRTYSKK